MPMMMTNRSVPIVYYVIENADGSLIFVSSSRGTEEVVAAQSAKIKKNVVANNVINYMKLTPTETGCNVETVQAFDVAGSIPDALKKKGAERMALQPMRTIHLIKTGEAPRA